MVCVSSVTIVVLTTQFRPPIKELMVEPEEEELDFSVCGGGGCVAASRSFTSSSWMGSFSTGLGVKTSLSWGECSGEAGVGETDKSSVASPFTRTSI